MLDPSDSSIDHESNQLNKNSPRSLHSICKKSTIHSTTSSSSSLVITTTLPFPTKNLFTYPESVQESDASTFISVVQDDRFKKTNNSLVSNSTSAFKTEKKSMKKLSSTRLHRRFQFGIDCPDVVQFKRWDPGNEYIYQLMIKNVSLKPQRLTYRISNNPYFLMNFPESVMLSPGMCSAFPILFKPAKSVPYQEILEFTCRLGTFSITLNATLPEHNLTFQSLLDFKICPISSITTNSILLKNKSELDTFFSWNFLSPFSINPTSGTLTAGKSCSIQISFLPKEAKPFSEIAVCTYGTGQSTRQKKIRLIGIGNFSHIKLECEDRFTNFINFDSVVFGQKSKKTITLINLTPVDSNFSITPLYSENSFSISKAQGIVPAFRKFDISLIFHPKRITSSQVTEAFQVTSVSGNNFSFKCTGTCIGPHITSSVSSVVFADTKLGTLGPVRSFQLMNSSDCSSFFHFRISSSSVFKLNPLFGPIPPNSNVYIHVTFDPKVPINYYREALCVLEDAPSFKIQFLGTAFTDEIRPATFTLNHLDLYRHRRDIGMGLYGPMELSHVHFFLFYF
ncbi:hypothetical protein HMI56_004209 [Coelomomyces lativittatus]|nr:hypothetical protein HMI56_004209 [Coelomomyces lativittatus]